MSPDDDHLREEPLRRRPVYEGRLLHVFEDTVRLPSGREARREVVEHIGAVAVVATDADARVVLVRQWRHATGRALWELPAGTREPGEDPATTARRELTEETGYGAREWRELGHGPVSPGYSSEEIWFYLATGLTAGDSFPDADELLDVGLFDAPQLANLAREGQVDLKTLAGLALAGVALDKTVAEDAADRLVARAIESVLDQVPGSIDTSVPEGGATKLQPWAETAAPVGRNKRPLEELLVELEERVAADPDAHATLPRTRHPALAFFDRFGRVPEGRPQRAAGTGEGTGRRRRRRRGGGQGARQEGAPAAGAASPAIGRPEGGRRRSRRGRGGGSGASAAPAAGGTPRSDVPAAGGQPRAPGSGGRRRRGRRGRGGERPPAA